MGSRGITGGSFTVTLASEGEQGGKGLYHHVIVFHHLINRGEVVCARIPGSKRKRDGSG
jgi:hypothetical protein